MIYASLRTIRQWHQPLTAPIYIALGLASGAVLLNLLLRAVRHGRRRGPTGSPSCAWSSPPRLKWAYWLRIDGEPREYTAEAATGLGHLGKVRPLEPPHTQPNFIMREMGYRVARKHALKLRNLALLLGFGLPIAAAAADAPVPAWPSRLAALRWRRCRWRSGSSSSAGCSSPRPSTCRCSTTAPMRRDVGLAPLALLVGWQHLGAISQARALNPARKRYDLGTD